MITLDDKKFKIKKFIKKTFTKESHDRAIDLNVHKREETELPSIFLNYDGFLNFNYEIVDAMNEQDVNFYCHLIKMRKNVRLMDEESWAAFSFETFFFYKKGKVIFMNPR